MSNPDDEGCGCIFVVIICGIVFYLFHCLHTIQSSIDVIIRNMK